MDQTRVIVLAGPSGAGKSRLARRLQTAHGWPLLQLDDFYREVGDPGLPMSPLGLVDWDDVGSWDLEAALTALESLCRSGSADVPVYDLSTSSIVGHQVVTTQGAPVVVAEGIFAAHVIAELEARGLLLTAWCVRNRPWVTFGRRLVRDLAERRKPPLTLWRRGHVLRRAEPGIVAAQQALGATPVTAREAESMSESLAANVRSAGG
ncbi:uridine kinase family protein [Ornithinimicrobium sp. Y1847]|uniref:uridine kinase family protein n=1 Tax=Ornithinimicrobium sp. Y1847 TaxID=3405419 RepID=UPI003B66CC4F